MGAHDENIAADMKSTAESLSAIYDELQGIADELPTKREFLAGLAMAGHLASFTGRTESPRVIAAQAVEYADALLAALAKPVGTT